MVLIQQSPLADREAVELDPQHSRALKLLGSALYAQGDLPGAKDALQSALALKPSYADAYCDLGCVLCALAEVQPAKEAFQNAVRLKPHHVEVTEQRHYVHRVIVFSTCASDRD